VAPAGRTPAVAPAGRTPAVATAGNPRSRHRVHQPTTHRHFDNGTSGLPALASTTRSAAGSTYERLFREDGDPVLWQTA